MNLWECLPLAGIMAHRPSQGMQSNMEQSEFKSKSGLKRIFSAFFYSIHGLSAAWRTEHAFRQELLLFVLGSGIALALRISAFEKLLLIGVLGLVLIVELLNSAIEAGWTAFRWNVTRCRKTPRTLAAPPCSSLAPWRWRHGPSCWSTVFTESSSAPRRPCTRHGPSCWSTVFTEAAG